LSLGLALVISFPISSVVLFSAVLFLVLAVISYLVYKARHKDLDNRDLAKNLLSDFRDFVANIFEDFGIVFARVSAWWLRREARIQEEMAQEHERKARRKEKLTELKQRRTRPFNEQSATREHQNIRRGSQEERTEG
jgi:hypothetical protein